MTFRPLVELHTHFDGLTKSRGIASMLDIAKQEGIKLPATDAAGLYKALRCGTIRQSLADYLDAFQYTTAVMQSWEALERLAYEHVQEWSEDGILYGELRFMPSLHCQRGLMAAEAVEAVLAGLMNGAVEYGVSSGLIICSMRHVSPAETERMMLLADAYKRDGVVAVDLAGDDLNFPALEHAKLYAWARARKLGVTIHAGEAGPPERVAAALDLFKAQRIGHGIRTGESAATLKHCIDAGVPFEVCPTSNVQIGIVKSYETHPARAYFQQGACVTINTDNRMLADTTLTEEFERVRTAWNLNDFLMKELVENAINASYAPANLKQQLLKELG